MKLDKNYITELKAFFGKDYNDILKALKFAVKKHDKDYRDDGTPYVNHPIRVAEFVRLYKPSKNNVMLYKAALLHDTIENTKTSYTELIKNFGEETASIVMELSTAKFASHWSGNGGKSQYLSDKMKYMTPYALTVKLCDRLDNVRSISCCSPDKQLRTINDTKAILESLRSSRKLTVSHVAVMNELDKEIEIFENKVINEF